VRPTNQPTKTGVALCHKKFGDPCPRQSQLNPIYIVILYLWKIRLNVILGYLKAPFFQFPNKHLHLLTFTSHCTHKSFMAQQSSPPSINHYIYVLRISFSGMWICVVWKIGTNISEKPAATILKVAERRQQVPPKIWYCLPRCHIPYGSLIIITLTPVRNFNFGYHELQTPMQLSNYFIQFVSVSLFCYVTTYKNCWSLHMIIVSVLHDKPTLYSCILVTAGHLSLSSSTLCHYRFMASSKACSPQITI
jgi:hypothetical protein